MPKNTKQPHIAVSREDLKPDTLVSGKTLNGALRLLELAGHDHEARLLRASSRPAPDEFLNRVDAGPWVPGVTSDERPRHYLQSEDFDHDVRLYIDGDFGSQEEKQRYAQGLAKQLNAVIPPPAKAHPCARPDQMGEHACTNQSQCWEPCGKLGKSAAHARVAN